MPCAPSTFMQYWPFPDIALPLFPSPASPAETFYWNRRRSMVFRPCLPPDCRRSKRTLTPLPTLPLFLLHAHSIFSRPEGARYLASSDAPILCPPPLPLSFLLPFFFFLRQVLFELFSRVVCSRESIPLYSPPLDFLVRLKTSVIASLFFWLALNIRSPPKAFRQSPERRTVLSPWRLSLACRCPFPFPRLAEFFRKVLNVRPPSLRNLE